MQSDPEGPVNIGSPQYFSVKELEDTVAKVACKKIRIKWVDGPISIQSPNFKKFPKYICNGFSMNPDQRRQKINKRYVPDKTR